MNTDGRDSTAKAGAVSVPRVRLPGVDALRTIAVAAVIYSHVSYYIIDDLGTGWWLIDGVYGIFIGGFGLNQHLSFVGVAFFMMLTGLLITGSAMRHSPGRFLALRIGRLLPLLWIAVAAAIVLVRLDINTMFSRQDGISNVEAALSFVLGGFFLEPEVVVLGVTWTLVVQIVFYVYCVAARRLLRAVPIAASMLGAALCIALLAYNKIVPEAWTVPMLSKVAATMPAVFVGQIIYLAWTRQAGWIAVAAAGLAQVAVVRFATDTHSYWGGDHYLWTMFVITGCVLLVARRDSRFSRSPIVHWLGTRSYPIYLVHTLILYRVFDHVAVQFGPTAAVVVFLIITGAVSEALYRWVEVPTNRWLTGKLRERRPEKPGVASDHVVVSRVAWPSGREVDAGDSGGSAAGAIRTDPAT